MIYVGNIVNTHGIKGEVKIISNIKHKKLVFKKKNKIIIDDNQLIINSYRVHKNFDMITFEGINDINDVLKYKGKKVYIERNEIDESILFDDDYIGLDVYSDRYIGKVIEVFNNQFQDILIVKNDDKNYMIPIVDEFIKDVDLKNKKILIKEIEGLIDEN